MNASGGGVKKQEDRDTPSDPKGRDIKPAVKILNRVPRACNACRKQKMRCEGADDPPCKRCRHANLECLFEKPSREASLTGEAGLERIRSLEASVLDIRNSQINIQSTLTEIVGHLRSSGSLHVRSPTMMHTIYRQSPSLQSAGSPSTPVAQAAHTDHHTPNSHPAAHGGPPMTRPHRGSISGASYSAPPSGVHGQPLPGAPGYHGQPPQPPYGNYPSSSQEYSQSQPSQGQMLPPFSNIQQGAASSQQGHYQPHAYNHTSHSQPPHDPSLLAAPPRHGAGVKRPASSTLTSADSSDVEEDDNGELPASGLVAPWEVLRTLADIAIQRAEQRGENFENGDSSEPMSRARTPTPERQLRPSKRRKTAQKLPPKQTFPDVVTKNILSEAEVRDLFRIFYNGCSTFLPVFDVDTDTFDDLHERSPFAVNCICMVAARVRDGGGKPSEAYTRCLEEVHNIAYATLFAPVVRHEAVQAMLLVSGWSDNGWLSGGHAVRMAMELSMHKAWPKLHKRMKANKMSESAEDRNLVVKSRTWFCLYLFEHQLSYGTGRSAILKDDESIWDCRDLLQHPLAIEDDMRLVSTVELMAIRERVNNNLGPFDKPTDESTFRILREADHEFQSWFATWDQAFSQKYEDAAFYRQSLQMQQYHAELYHNATALRGINGIEDVQNMPPFQKEVALRSIHIARQGLDITVSSPAYREGMKYAVHYTHATATFAASFLLRLARLFPNDCDIQGITAQVEQLADLMSELPGKRYAWTLKLMMRRMRKRTGGGALPPPEHIHGQHHPMAYPVDHGPGVAMQHHPDALPVSPTYEQGPYQSPGNMHDVHAAQVAMPYQHEQSDGVNVDTIWHNLETSATDPPVWFSDQTLGANSLQQNGMDAFFVPQVTYQAQIW